MEEPEKEGLLAIGGKFGSYDVLKLLGSGGMGEVYLLRSTSNGEFYAGKVMYPSTSGEGGQRECEWRKRFANEAMFAMKVSHRNLIRVHDAGEDPETKLCYIIMDYMAGGTLAERIHAKGRLDVGEAVKIALKVAAALDVAHRAGIVHRDIKPDNIMFDDDGVPHLADLGIAKFSASNVTMTNAKMVIGTPAYMAPEQMMDSHKVDARADVYSLGIVLYEMLAGACPHENTSVMELLSKVMKGEELQNICKIRDDVSPAVGYALSLMTANKAAHRPADARAAARMLYAAYKGKLRPRYSLAMRLAGLKDRFAGTSAVFKAGLFLASALCAVVAALAFARMRSVPRGRGASGGGRGATRTDRAPVQTNEVDIALYSVVVVTNQVGEAVTVTNAAPQQLLAGQRAPADDWDEEDEDEYVSTPRRRATEARSHYSSGGANVAGAGGLPDAASGAQHPQAGALSAELGEESGATELKIKVDGGSGSAAVEQAGFGVSGVPGVGEAKGGRDAAQPAGRDATRGGGTDASAAATVQDEGEKVQRVDEPAQVDGYTPLKGSFAVDALEVKLSNVPPNIKEDIKRRQNEYSSRLFEWGALGCIVYGRVQLERADGVNGISTWAWMQQDGSFTAAMHPKTSEGRIVFLHHGYERLCVNVPPATQRWKKDVAYSLGTLTMHELAEDQAGAISFRLRLPKNVSSATVRIELAGDYPLGYNRTRRPNMSATVVKKKMRAGQHFELKGCVRDRYVVTIDSPLCRLYTKALVLGEEASHGVSDCVVTNGIADMGEVYLRHPKNAVFFVQDKRLMTMKKETIVDNRNDVDFFPGINACFRSVDGDESILRLESDDDDVVLYDCGSSKFMQFRKGGIVVPSDDAVKSEDGIIRRGRVYCLGLERYVPEIGTFFCLESY